MRFVLCFVICVALPCALGASYFNFESPHVHPLDMTPDGNTLLAVNTDDHRLSVFDLTGGSPVLVAEVPVGLEPVSVRARTNTEAWVVNHLSDSVSLVDLTTFAVTQTLVVGDEPTDVAFAGAPQKAFVCVSQEDKLKVYVGPTTWTPVTELVLEGSDARSLEVDGDDIWVTFLDSQNRTTIVPETVVTGSLGLPPPVPPMDSTLAPAPGTGLIVKDNGFNWVDELNRPWDFALPYKLPDVDLVKVDSGLLAVTQSVTGVGTTLFNVAVNSLGTLYVSNQEAFNEIRFEPNLKGKFVQNRVTVVDPGGPAVTPVHLNGHINYAVEAGDPLERSMSLGTPLDMVVTPDDLTVYVAAFGSAKIGVLDASGAVVDRINVGHGPTGLAYDDPRGQLYVLERTDLTVSTVDPVSKTRTTVPLGFHVVPADIQDGRRVFYDTENSSAHGDLSCASCHVFAGMDNISWDLGNPLGEMKPAPPGQLGSSGFHPMKGPMATQSLKGLQDTEPLHWRGDNENLGAFNPAFVSLMGRSAPLSPTDSTLFDAFVMSVRYPPNPNRDLDNSYFPPADGSDPVAGEAAYMTGNLVGGANCVDCHALPTGENGLIIPNTALLEPQDMVVPQLRNMYEKTRFDNTVPFTVRGFGYTHDGAVDDLFTFLQFPAFTFVNDDQRRDVASFLLAFDTGTHPALGAQWTMDGTNEVLGTPRLDMLEAEADSGGIGLIAKGRDSNGDHRGWTYTGVGDYIPDRESEGTWTRADLLLLAGAGTEITFTAVVAGCETRLGVDRDEDGARDRDELDGGSDPNDPNSLPTISVPEDAGVAARLLLSPNPIQRGSVSLRYSLEQAGPVAIQAFDVRGRLVATVVEESSLPAGAYVSTWNLQGQNGLRVAKGIYFLRLQTPVSQLSSRLVVID